MLIDDIKALKTPAREMLMGLYNEIQKMIFIPNSLLPEKLHGRETNADTDLDEKGKVRKRVGRSAASLMKKKAKVLETENKAEQKESRLIRYCDDVDAEREIQFIEDDDRLYRQQVAFCKILGLIDADDVMGG